MRIISRLLLLVVIGLVGIGCDSNGDEDMSIADLIADGWMLTAVSDSEGDQTVAFAEGFDGVEITFTESGDFSIFVDSNQPGEDNTITGTWSVNESQNSLTLTTTFSGIPINLVFSYAFSGDDILELTAASSTSVLLGQLFTGSSLQGTITITVARS